MSLALKPALAALSGVAVVGAACWWLAAERARREPPPQCASVSPAALPSSLAAPASPVPVVAPLALRVVPGDWGRAEWNADVVSDRDALDPENKVEWGSVALRVESGAESPGCARITLSVTVAERVEHLAFDVPRGASDGAVLSVQLLDASEAPSPAERSSDVATGSRFGSARFDDFEGTLTLRDTRFSPGERVPMRLDLRYSLVRDAELVVCTEESTPSAPARRTRVRAAGIIDVEAPSK